MLKGRYHSMMFPELKTIRTQEIVSDISAGMSVRQLMDKYDVSINSLHNLLRKLVLVRALQISEVQALLASAPQELGHDRRKEQRYYVFVPLPIYDMGNLFNEGQVVDISQGGLRITGLSARFGDKKNFLIQPDYFLNVLPFTFEAECRWVFQSEREPCMAGFQITDISDRCLEELKKIVRAQTSVDLLT
jgi:hypothetical protein